MNRILVTGGAGFIAFHLIKRLLSDGYSVVSIDNMNDYYDVDLKYSRLNQLEKIKTGRYEFHKMDLNDKNKLEDIFSQGEIGCVVNLAAQAGVRYAKKNPDTYIDSNVTGFYNLLRASQQNDVKKVIYASSSSVYGANEKLPFSEDDAVNTPMSIYAATKKSNEDLASGFFYSYGIRTIGLRFFNIYGPYGRPDMAYFGWTDKITKGEQIELREGGEMWRDMTYIDDCVECICRLIDSDESEDRPEIYNIGNRKPVKIKDMLDTITTKLGIDPRISIKSKGAEEPVKTWADTTRIKNKINFEPNTDHRVGIERFLDWYTGYNNGA